MCLRIKYLILFLSIFSFVKSQQRSFLTMWPLYYPTEKTPPTTFRADMDPLIRISPDELLLTPIPCDVAQGRERADFTFDGHEFPRTALVALSPGQAEIACLRGLAIVPINALPFILKAEAGRWIAASRYPRATFKFDGC